MRKIREILRLKWEAGLTHRDIARARGVGLGTITDYMGRAKLAGLSWPLPDELDDAALDALFFPAPKSGHPARPLPDNAWIHRELKRPGVTLLLLWMEYLEAHPDGNPTRVREEGRKQWGLTARHRVSRLTSAAY